MLKVEVFFSRVGEFGGLELEVGIFEEAIKQDDELSHDGGESDHLLFTSGEEALVEVLQDGIEAGGAEGGHVKGVAHRAASTGDAPGGDPGAALANVGREASEGGPPPHR